jgi:hypothetical protein
MHKNLVSREFVTKDCAKLCRLHELVWKFKTNEDYWRWKYNENPFWTKGMVVEKIDGTLLAFCGFWGRPATIGDKIFPSIALCDVMAHPEYRGGAAFRIILRRIAKEILPKQLFFGFTNPISHNIFVKYFRKIDPLTGTIPVLSAVLSAEKFFNLPRPFKAAARKFLSLVHKFHSGFHNDKEGVFVKRVEIIDNNFDRLWEDVSSDYYFILNRGKEYLKWRYTAEPGKEYQIWIATDQNKLIGYMVTSIISEPNIKRGVIIDWLVPRSRIDVFRQLIQTTLIWMVNQKIDILDTWLMDHESEWARVLKSHFFIKRRKRTFALGGGPVWFNPEYQNYHDEILKMENHFYTCGDSDYLGISNL